MNALGMNTPPHSIESEQSVLGSLMVDGGKAFDRIVGRLVDGDFYRDDHRRIFRHITRLFDTGKPIDVVSVAESIDTAGETEHTGGLAYLGDMFANTPSAASILHYADIVKSKSMLRRLQSVAVSMLDACANPGGGSVDEIAASAEAGMQECLDRSNTEPQTLADVFGEVISYVDERCQRGDELAGLATGFDGFDRLTGGLEPGQLVIVAARPSVGKTMLAVNFADRTAQRGRSVLFFTLEMSGREIGMRLLSARAKVSVHAMRGGTNDKEHWGRLVNEQGKAGRQRLFIDDKGAIGVGYVRAKARRIKRQNGLDLIVIDYLGLMKGQGDNRTQEIGSLSRGLKALAKELAVPIIVLAQLNRGVESRTDKRPMLSDMRDSGEVEQDADIVVMLHRESIYSAAPEWEGLAELLVRKNRNGPLGEILLRYRPEEMRFDETNDANPRRTSAATSNCRGGYTRGFDN